MARYVISKSKNGQYYFNLKAGNGETILTSETHVSKQSAENGISSVRTNSQSEDRFKLWKNGEATFYFTLVAGNGETIGTSEMYVTRQGRDNGKASVKANAPSAVVVDAT